MKIKFRDKIIALVLISIFAIYAVFNYIVIPANKEVDKLKEKKEKVAAILSDIEPLLKETEEKEAQKAEAQKKYDQIKFEEASKTATSEEFLVYIGKNAEENNVKVTGFSDLGSIYDDGIYRAYYDIELSGTPFSINRVIKELDKMGIVCSVGSVSFRQDKEYDYLNRFFDFETNLKWYTEPEEEEETESTEKEEPPGEIETAEPKPGEIKPAETIPPIPVTPPPASNEQQDPPVHKNEEPQTKEPDSHEGFVVPDEESIENRLDDLLKLRSSNSRYKVIPLANTVVSENPYTDEMRLSFTVCLVMFSEPSSETSFIKIEKVEESEDAEDDV